MDDHDSTPAKVSAGGQGSGDLSNIVAISAGDHHVLALDSSGHVWAWGYNEYGQLGNNSETNSDTPIEVQAGEQNPSSQGSPLSDIVYIDAGFDYSTAIDLFGRVWVWGQNGYKLGLGTSYPSCYLRPKLMPNTK